MLFLFGENIIYLGEMFFFHFGQIVYFYLGKRKPDFKFLPLKILFQYLFLKLQIYTTLKRLKKPKSYLGNGKVFWNNGSIVNAEREAQPTEVSAEGDLF